METKRDALLDEGPESKGLSPGSEDRLLFDANPNPMYVFDEDSLRLLAVNEAMVAKYGWSRSELLEMKVTDLRPPEEVPRLLDALAGQEGVRAGSVGEWRHRRRDGTCFEVEVTASCIDYRGRTARLVMANDITERKQAEEALRASEKKYRLLFAANPNPMFVIDGESLAFLAVNDAAVRHYGWSDGEFGELSFLELHPPEEQAMAREAVAYQRDADAPGVCVLRQRRRDDSPIEVEMSANSIDFAGRAALLCSINDITARRQAEEARIRSDERFQIATRDHYLKRELYDELRSNPAIIEFLESSSLDGLWYWDLENAEHEWMSPTFWRTFGYEPEEKQHLASEWQDMISPEDLELSLDNFRRHCADPRHPYDQLARYRHKDGWTVWIRCRGMVIRDADGKPRRMLGVHNDVTAALRSQADRVRDQQFRAFFESAAVGALQLDPQGRLSRVNARFSEITGFRVDELLGRELLDFVHPDDQPGDREAMEELLRAGTTRLDRESRFRAKDDRTVWVHLTASLIQHPDDSFTPVAIVEDVTERRLAEEKLRESEERFRHTFENAAVGIAQVAPDGRWLRVNDQLCSIVGYTRDELLEKTFADITHPDDVDADWALAHRVLAGELDTYWIEKRYLRKGGGTIWVTLTVSLVRRPDGTPDYFISIVRDISVRRKAEDELEASRERFAAIVGSAMDAIITVDEQLRVVLFNGAAEAMFRLSANEAVGSPVERFIPERLREAHLTQLRNFDDAGDADRSMGGLGWPLTGLRSDGTEFPIEASLSRIEAGGEKLFTVILRDITERQVAAAALEEERSLLRSLIDLLPDFIYVKDRESRFLLANQACARNLGASSPEGLLGHTDAEYFPPEVAAEFRADEVRTLEGQSLYNKEEAVASADGSTRILLTTKVPLRDRDGKITGVVGTGRDITLRKESQEKIRQLYEDLERRVEERTAELAAANRELEAFSYSVSHDLRAPLRSVSGFSEILIEDYADQLEPAARDYLERVRGASQRMARLIDVLLELSRVSRGEMRYETVALGQLARSVANELQATAPKRKVDWVIDERAMAWGDARLLRVLFENLLGNAWKYTGRKERARIEFGCGAAGTPPGTWFVGDNGAGFDMRYAARLFTPFQRLHSSDEFEGQGIGLATVQRIVNRHGGLIRAASRPNEGAVFYFTLAPDHSAT